MKIFKNKYILFSSLASLIFLIILIASNIMYSRSKVKPYNEFLKDLNTKNVSEVYVTNSATISVKLKNNTIYQTDNPRNTNFKESLLNSGIKVSEHSLMSLVDVIPSILFVVSVVFLIISLIKSSNVKNKGLVSVELLDAASVEGSKYTFNDVAGNEEAKESVKDIVDFLKNPEKYSTYGARMPRGIMLYGQPGTGKTLLAKAVAGEAGVPFYAMSGSDFIQVYVGVGASRVRQLFKKARLNGRAVIFIDEIDAIGKKRDSGSTGGSDERDQTLNALLTEMSGFNDKEGIIVMAATNRLDMLDPALLRPGRFDRHIEIQLPDVTAREKIISLHLKNKPLGSINLRELAEKTSYFSGAKLEHLVNEAAIIACKENSENIDSSHLDKAYSIVVAGYEKVNRDSIKETDKKITAFHEAGHALVSMKVLPEDKVSKVTIIPSTKGAGGYTLSIPKDQMYHNKSYLEKRVMVLLAGRAAEEIVFGSEYVTTGAHTDIKQSTEILMNMITEYGMGDSLGLLNAEGINRFSSAYGNNIVLECKNNVEKLYNNTKDIIKENINMLNNMSNALIEKETLTQEDLSSYLGDN